jgi:hypothetical protein
MKFATSFPLPGIPDTVSMIVLWSKALAEASQSVIKRPQGVDL